MMPGPSCAIWPSWVFPVWLPGLPFGDINKVFAYKLQPGERLYLTNFN